MRLLKKHVYCSYDEFVKVSDMKPNPMNPNTHPAIQVLLLAELIKEHGWRVPVTVSTRSGFIVRGHGGLMAAQELKLDKVPVDYQDYETETDEMADLVADNKIQELSSLDDEMVQAVLLKISDESKRVMTGFDLDEIDGLLGDHVGFLNDFLETDSGLDDTGPGGDPGGTQEDKTQKFYRLPMEFSYADRDLIVAAVSRYQEAKKINMSSGALLRMVEEFGGEL